VNLLTSLGNKSSPTPRAPDKCGHSPTLAGDSAPTADSTSGGFLRQIPPLPVTPAVGRLLRQGLRFQKKKIYSMGQAYFRKGKHWRWVAGVLVLALICIVGTTIVFPKNLIFIFPNAAYPKSQTISKKSNSDFTIPYTVVALNSATILETNDAIEKVYEWYINHAWKETYRNQGIGVEKGARINLPLNYALLKSSSIWISQSGNRTKIEVWTGIFLLR
jgi:hypothetical protein